MHPQPGDQWQRTPSQYAAIAASVCRCIRLPGLEKLSTDALTAHSIGAAAFEALKNSPDADSIVVTRVVAESHGPDKVCTTIYGRAIKLRKANEPSTPDHADEDELARPDQ